MLSANILCHSVLCVLDTGSTYSLIPHKIWKTFQLNPNLLDTSVIININSASHRVKNAVLGRIILSIEITNDNGEIQTIDQLFFNLKRTLGP